MDGSLTILYFCPITTQWHIATRKNCEADQIMDNGKYTFRTLYEKALKETNGMSFDDFTSTLDKGHTYLFELTSPLNQIVCSYSDTRLTWLMARNINTLQELDITKLDIGIPQVHKYALNNIDEILAFVSSQNPSEHEGVVVCDGEFRRIKIKNPAYVVAHKLKDTICASPRNMLEVILLEKDDDIISLLPQELINDLNNMKQKVHQLIHNYDKIYNEVVAKLEDKSKKAFAIAIQKEVNWTAPFFKIFDKKAANMKELMHLLFHII